MASAKTEGQRVLVVDDQPRMVEFLRDVLYLDGHIVEVAYEGEEALKKIRKSGYDIIISDLEMPELSGQELYKILCKENSTLARRMVFISGNSDSPEVRKFIKEAGNLYLSKPFSIDKLRQAIQQLLP